MLSSAEAVTRTYISGTISEVTSRPSDALNACLPLSGDDMDPLLAQRTRYLLQARVRRVKTCPRSLFRASCAQFLTWVRHHPLLLAIVQELAATPSPFFPSLAAVDEMLQGKRRHLDEEHWYAAESLQTHAALCLAVLDRIACSKPPSDDVDGIISPLVFVLTGQNKYGEDALELIRDVAVDGLYEFLDERLDSRNVMLGLLLKYKQRCEWFHRRRLRELGTEGAERKRPGEESLAVDLQEYIFDQGVDFTIEPTSASGEADIVLRDADGSHIVLDAKLLALSAAPSEFRRKIAHGVHQVARYCADYNEPVGYLVIFNCDPRIPRIPTESSDGFQYVELQGKQVYITTISIADIPTASAAGKAHEVEITLADILSKENAGV